LSYKHISQNEVLVPVWNWRSEFFRCCYIYFRKEIKTLFSRITLSVILWLEKKSEFFSQPLPQFHSQWYVRCCLMFLKTKYFSSTKMMEGNGWRRRLKLLAQFQFSFLNIYAYTARKFQICPFFEIISEQI